MKKLARPVRKVNAFTLGMDVHQRQITFAALDPHGDDSKQGQIDATGGVVITLLKSMPRPLHVAFEAGGSTFWLYDVLCKELGAEFVHVAQPKKIRAIANMTDKDDLNDAWWSSSTHPATVDQDFPK